jgi:hypothetical protein
MLSVISIRKNRLKYPIIAVIVASVTASATPCFPRCFLRNEATCMLNLITKAPYNPFETDQLRNGGGKRKEPRGWLYPEDTEDNEEHDLEKMPISVISDLEQYQLSGSEGVHGLMEKENQQVDLCAFNPENRPITSRLLRGHRGSSSTSS